MLHNEYRTGKFILGDIRIIATSDEESSTFSLTNSQAALIAKVSVALERELFKGVSPTDVEFVIGKDGDIETLYLVQVCKIQFIT